MLLWRRSSIALVLLCLLAGGFLISRRDHLAADANKSAAKPTFATAKPAPEAALSVSSARLALNRPRLSPLFRDFAAAPAPRTSGAYGDLPLAFEENQGQTDSRVKYLARGKGYTLFLTPKEAVLSLRYADPAQAAAEPSALSPNASPLRSPRTHAPKWSYSALELAFVGAKHPALEGIEKLEGITNYFIGNDPSQWHTEIPNYRKVAYRNAFPGIDVAYYGNPGQLETDFVVKPGANPRAIQLRAKGATSTRLDANGDLLLTTAAGDVRLHKPVVYQESAGARREIAGNYRLREDGRLSFSVAAYDRSLPLVIDPTLTFSTFLGGSTVDQANGVAADSAGEAYVTGFTSSTDFPTSATPLQGATGGAPDAFVTKYNAGGTAFVFSTYLGGNSSDQANGIALDSSGNAFIAGITNSSNFPGTANSTIQNSLSNSFSNGFVSKISANGATLLFSTYLGGRGNDTGGDSANAIAVDKNGDAYVTGFTSSDNFPNVAAFQTTALGGEISGCSDGGNCTHTGFVTKIKGDGSTIVYSSYLGGELNDQGNGIAVDPSLNAYVTGQTTSGKFNTVAPIQANLGAPGATNAFAAEVSFSTTGPAPASTLVYSTYLGGSGIDSGAAIAADSTGNAYVAGTAGSADFPLKNSLQAPDNGGDPFVTKVATGGASFDFSTLFGGGGDIGTGIALDSTGNIYITGETSAQIFPTKVPLQAILSGSQAAFVVELKNDGSDSIFSTYLGGSSFDQLDQGNAIAVDSSANIYVAGLSGTLDFPTVTPFQVLPKSLEGNAFVAKIAPATPAGTQMYPPNLNFGSVVQNTTATEVLTLAAGTNPVTVNSVTIGGANPGDFTEFDSCGPATIPPTVVCAFTIGFTPTANGPRSATFTINEASGQLSFTASGMGTAAPTTPPNGTVTLSPTSIAFPNQEVTVKSAVQNIAVTVATNPVTLQLAASSAGTNPGDFLPAAATTNPCPSNKPIAVGITCNIGVVFDPQATGPRSATFGVFGNITPDPTTINVSGTGTAAPTLLPTFIQFPGTVSGTTSAPMNVTLTNTVAGTALTGITPQISGPFTITGTTCPGPAGGLAGGANCTISIAFSPPANAAPLANLSGTLVVTDSDPALLSVSLFGTALNPNATIVSFTNSILFGRVPDGTLAGNSVLVENGGNTNLSVTPTLNTTAPTGTFQLVNNCTSPVTPGSLCTAGINFTPPSAGPFFATITLTGTNPAGGAATNSPQNVQVSGTGVAATTSKLSPNPLVFPAIPPGQTSAVEYAFLSNTGTSIDFMQSQTIAPGTFQNDFNPNNNGKAPFNTLCFPADPLNPQGVCAIGVTFTPSTTGVETATLMVTDTSTNTPLSITLQGGQAAGPLTVTPSSLTFGTQIVNTTSAAMPVTVSNGTAFNQTVISIVPPTGFGESDNCTAALAPGAACTINVTFTPTSATQFQGNLQVSIQQGLGSPAPAQFAVALTGTGTNATFTLSFAPGSSGTVTTNPGGTATVGILVTGTKGIAQTVNLSATTTSNTINTAVTPASIQLTGIGDLQVAAVLQTFCRGTTPGAPKSAPPWTGLGAMLAALLLAAIAFTYRRQPRWAVALALLLLMGIAGAACGGDPGSNGPTPPGTYPVTLTATSGQQVQTLNITLVVK